MFWHSICSIHWYTQHTQCVSLVSQPHCTNAILKRRRTLRMVDHISNRTIKFCQHVTLIYEAVTNLQSTTHFQPLLHNNNKVQSRAPMKQTQLDRRRPIFQLCVNTGVQMLCSTKLASCKLTLIICFTWNIMFLISAHVTCPISLPHNQFNLQIKPPL